MLKFKLSLPAELHLSGDIIVTDPCYFIEDENWDALIKSWYKENDSTEYTNLGVIEYENGAKVIYTSTAFGDGEYPVYVKRGNGESVHNDSTGVDAGMVAAISVEDILKINPDFAINNDSYPRINDFDGTIKADGNGNLVGDLEVNTQGEEHEENYGYEEEEDEYGYLYWNTDEN